MSRRLLSASVAVGALVVATAPLARAEPGDPPPDVTGPVITVTAPAAAWEGWYADAVDLTVRATDASGIDTFGYTLSGATSGEEWFAGPTGSVRISNAGVTTITLTASDGAFNGSTRTYNVGIDLTDPTIDISGVANGVTVVQHSARPITFGCADVGTGVASCTSTPAYASGQDLDTTTLGEHTVTVTALDRVGRSRQRAVRYTVVQPDLQIQSAGSVSGFTDAPRIGDHLHASGAVFVPTAETVTYRWVRGGTVVATGADYTVTAADLGQELGLTVTGQRSGYNDRTWGTRWLPHVVKGAFEVTGVGRLLGAAAEGRTLSVQAPASVTPAPTSTSHEWTIGTRVVTTTGPSLTLTSAMVGQQVSVRIRYASATHADIWVPVTLSGVPDTATRTAHVTGKAWTVVRRSAVRGTPRAGRVLTAVLPVLSGRPGRYTYQWLRDGKVVRGATGARFQVRAADRRHRISVRVRALTPYRPSTSSTAAPVRIR